MFFFTALLRWCSYLLLVAVLAGLLLLRRQHKSTAKGRAPVKDAPKPKGTSTSQAGGGIMDTARIQSTGGTDIPLSPGKLCFHSGQSS